MTYSPGNPGYPPANQPTTQFSAPTQNFGKLAETPTADGPSKLPGYLLMAAAVLGLLVYLLNFGPIFEVNAGDIFGQGGTVSGSTLGIGLAVISALLAGLLAGASLLVKNKGFIAVSAVLSVLAFLLIIAELVNKPEEASIGWALYVLIVVSLLQAGTSVAALLYDTGVLTPPTPRPKYDQQQQYGQYGAPGGYYGQPHSGQHQAQHHGGHQGPPQQVPQQRPGYPTQYGGYPGGSGPSTGGFSGGGQQSGPPTPPTGFPTYGQPQQQAQSGSGQSTAPQQPQSSQQSGPTSS
ncbi:hypothetical protein E4P42_02760 [Mycobacterium sp. PS03-16]|uniref:DUF5336 domain-containing protein n=1 Tax=Mycobacterium sp. PS03-16 TaxID=2559611 RepID=UPI0010731719|nr:DUF5336 domain-containing protein [Mycobacterium sp. PS03-16]TFV61110.1 hypothetical protein E4P42_02760 [Mycobacterium sp. PS03-16]